MQTEKWSSMYQCLNAGDTHTKKRLTWSRTMAPWRHFPHLTLNFPGYKPEQTLQYTKYWYCLLLLSVINVIKWQSSYTRNSFSPRHDILFSKWELLKSVDKNIKLKLSYFFTYFPVTILTESIFLTERIKVYVIIQRVYLGKNKTCLWNMCPQQDHLGQSHKVIKANITWKCVIQRIHIPDMDTTCTGKMSQARLKFVDRCTGTGRQIKITLITDLKHTVGFQYQNVKRHCFTFFH